MFHLLLVGLPFFAICLFIYGIYLAFRPYKDEPDDSDSDGCDDNAESGEPTAKEHDDKAQGNIDLTIPFLIIFILLAIAGVVFLLYCTGWIDVIERICSLIL